MKIKLLTHTDLDGVGCAILAYLAFGRENVDVEYCDYKDVDERVVEFVENEELYSSYDNVFITDISVSEGTALLVGLRDVPPRKVRLFDHHVTALGLNTYEWCEVRVEDILTGFKTCGTEMFFCYLLNRDCFPELGRSKFRNLARFVEIVRDYDTWRWKELGEEGVVCKQVNDLFGIYGREAFIEWILRRINYPKVFPYFPALDERDCTLLEYKQKDIDIYIEQKNKQLQIYQDSYDRFVGVVFAERYISELGNRLCEMHSELDYVALVNLGAGVVSFRTCRDDLDLGNEIAHSLGGGGHKNAAGAEFGSEIADEVVRKLFGSGEELTLMHELKWDSGDSVERKRKFTVAVVGNGGTAKRLVDILLSEKDIKEIEEISVDTGVKFENLLRLVAISEVCRNDEKGEMNGRK